MTIINVGRRWRWFKLIWAALRAMVLNQQTVDVVDLGNTVMLLPDQPPPKDGTGDVWRELLQENILPDDVIPYGTERRLLGLSRYGKPVQRDNGRDHRVDALQEALDLMVYLHAMRAPRWTISVVAGVTAWLVRQKKQ